MWTLGLEVGLRGGQGGLGRKQSSVRWPSWEEESGVCGGFANEELYTEMFPTRWRIYLLDTVYLVDIDSRRSMP